MKCRSWRGTAMCVRREKVEKLQLDEKKWYRGELPAQCRWPACRQGRARTALGQTRCTNTMRPESHELRSRGGVLRCKPHVRLPVVPLAGLRAPELGYKRSSR
eukprot:8920117-Heterocapsa_arctica.AAC.1